MSDWQPMKNLAYISLSEAAKLTGKNKGTISKAIKDSRLSYVEKTSAGYKIDKAELFRVFPKVFENPTETPQNVRLATHEKTHKYIELNADIKILEADKTRLSEKIGELEETLKRERQQADHWQQQATNLLTDQREQEAAPVQNSGLLGGLRNILWGSGSK
jgi:hypothetical protein